jgi:hypothetical protein
MNSRRLIAALTALLHLIVTIPASAAIHPNSIVSMEAAPKGHTDETVVQSQLMADVNQRAKLTRQPGISALNFDHPG